MSNISKLEVNHLLSLPGVTVQKRRNFKVPKTPRPKIPNKNKGQDKFNGQTFKPKKPGRYVCMKGDQKLDKPERKP
jgi:hypothetical protein